MARPPQLRRSVTVEPVDRLLGRTVRTIDEWITVSVRVSRWPAAWITMHRLLSLPLLVRGACSEAVADPGLLVSCIGQPQRFARVLGAGFAPGQRALKAHRWGAAFHPGGVKQADVEAREVHVWAAERFRRSGWTLFPEFVQYRGDLGNLARS